MYMNVAILVRGLHYNTKYKDGIDYKKTIDNFKENIISNLYDNYHNIEIHTYISTYDSEYFEECKKDYNVTEYVLNEFNEYSRHSTIANGLNLIQNKDYDLVILYRFDIRLKMKILDLPNLKLDCLNIPFFSPGEWKGTKRINDGYVILCVARAKTDCTFEIGVESHDKLYRNPFIDPLASHELKANIATKKGFNS